jgi:hypothetical protein
MARIVRGGIAVLSWAVLVRWYVADPAIFVCLGLVLIAAGPVVRLAVRSSGRTEVDLPAGPSRFATLITAGCLTVTKAAIGEGLLPRRNDRLMDKS